jgi:hypothetical protein
MSSKYLLFINVNCLTLFINSFAQQLNMFRGNRSLRYMFQNRAADLYVFFLGSHDEIKTLFRSRKLQALNINCMDTLVGQELLIGLCVASLQSLD